MTQAATGDSIATKQNITILPGDKEGTEKKSNMPCPPPSIGKVV